MDSLPFWTRRRFLASTAATAAVQTGWGQGLSQTGTPPKAQSAATSPEEIAGSIRGLMRGQTARPLRYAPRDGGLFIRNGKEFFNRPLYGPNNAFRVDCGDLPEFSLYLPGHGGNLRIGVAHGGQAKWLAQCESVEATYRSGRMVYQVQDEVLGHGVLRVEAMTAGAGSGLMLKVTGEGLPDGLQMIWAFGGVSGRKGKRGGDIGCEVEPVSQFFQVRPAECAGNVYTLQGPEAQVVDKAITLRLTFPEGSTLQQSDGARWNASWQELQRPQSGTSLPILIGSVALASGDTRFVTIQQGGEPAVEHEAAFAARTAMLDSVSGRLEIVCCDPFVGALGGALAIAGDALWDDKQRCVMHGAVAWRMPLAGWRGPYVLDALGWHERFREHARHWITRQNTSPVTTASPAIGGPDPTSHLARSEAMLHSNGDLSHNHYDMNLVFFDAVLRHLQWTGDLGFAREIWPALVLHLAWEQRLFRRLYEAPSGHRLPLYEGYACIWASDNLQYSGGGASHSSAYNVYANRQAARLARMLGENHVPYEQEAAAITDGMRELLWLRAQGTFGESKDLMEPQTVYSSPALWSVYHTIDSEVPTPREAWQMARERLMALPAVPIEGQGVPPGGRMLSCSDWLPYEWSLNLLLLAENMHTALALWQAGMPDEAYALFQGNMLDSLFQGLCPGNFHMTSQLDDHRQEAQRDFGDPIGITARALVEGLFGVRPDLLADVIRVQPGFPAGWTTASLKHPDFDLSWRREGDHETLELVSRFARPVALTVALRALRSGKPLIRVEGTEGDGVFDADAVGAPLLRVEAPAAPRWKVEVQWKGEAVEVAPAHRTIKAGERMAQHAASEIDDPQQCLRDGRAFTAGSHTIFLPQKKGACAWWMPMSFTVEADPIPVPSLQISGQPEPLDLTPILTHRITEIFTRGYDAPRSKFCSLSIPRSGTGGWATFDRQPPLEDAGLRGEIAIPGGIRFHTSSSASNCLFLSHWEQDRPTVTVPLNGHGETLALLLAGTTLPQCSRMVHGTIRVHYTDGTHAEMTLRNPENWWPIEQDYLTDDYLFVDTAPPPVRVNLATGIVRLLDAQNFKGRGRAVPGGAANVLLMALEPHKRLREMELRVELYGIVLGLLAATVVRA